jgi:hypothetical protein
MLPLGGLHVKYTAEFWYQFRICSRIEKNPRKTLLFERLQPRCGQAGEMIGLPMPGTTQGRPVALPRLAPALIIAFPSLSQGHQFEFGRLVVLPRPAPTLVIYFPNLSQGHHFEFWRFELICLIP